MEQRELLKDQIEQLGKVLPNILSDLLRLKSKGQTSQGIEATNQRLQGEQDSDMEKITAVTEKDRKDYLKHRHVRDEHVEILSECLREIGKGKVEENKKDAKA